MDLKLRNSSVLVTGAGRGLGKEIGMGFAREGASVAFHYKTSRDGALAAAKEARQLGADAVAVGADIRDRAQTEEAVSRVLAALGSVDILINNAAFTERRPFLESGPDHWRPQIDVTIGGMLHVTRCVTEIMAKRATGSIVNLMGDSGRVGESGLVTVATTRAACMGFTKSLAKELARHGIRANCVSLGVVRTGSMEAHLGNLDEDTMNRMLRQYPLRRLGTAEDVVPTILLLASPLSDWTTGQVVSVNGGYAMP